METWADWLSLKNVPGIGDLLFKRLIDQFETPSAIFQAARETPDQLHGVEGLAPRHIEAIAQYQPNAAIHREIELVRKNKFTIITMADPDYQAPAMPPIMVSPPRAK